MGEENADNQSFNLVSQQRIQRRCCREHCSGIIRHETWCITRNDEVAYAYKAVLDADKLSLGDQLILHALGVVWGGKLCHGVCKSLTTTRPMHATLA